MVTIGDRIRQARLAAGLNQRELAERAAPLSAMAVSKYERGEDIPRPSVLLRLARALSVGTDYFLRTTRVSLECPQYRRRKTLGVEARAEIEELVRERLEPYLEVEGVFPAGSIEAPSLTPDDGYPVASLEDAEDAAKELRRRWDLGSDPIDNLPETLEDHGVKVLLIPASQDFDGLSCWANGGTPVVVVNDSKPWDRQRSDLAHEIGELYLRPAPEVDRERAAQRFAGAFLAPKEAVIRELGRTRATLTLEELRLVKEEYGLNMQAWVMRALDCGVITKATLGRLFVRFGQLGLRKDEKTSPRAPDRPQRFPMLVYRAEAERLITPIRRAELLGKVPQPSRPQPTPAEIAAAADSMRGYYATGQA